MTKDIFTKKWVIHFANPSRTKRVLVLLDGHYIWRHIQNIEAINSTINNYTDIICFMLYIGHLMQPLDVSFMAHLKFYFNKSL